MYIICTKLNVPEQMFRVNRETTADMAPFQTAPEIDQSEHQKKLSSRCFHVFFSPTCQVRVARF